MDLAQLSYKVVDGWEQLPAGWTHPDVVDVAVDSRDRVFVFSRSEHPVTVYESDGSFVASWGEGIFTNPHGLTIGPDGAVYCVDNGDHTVRKFTPEGELVLTLGTPHEHSDTGSTGVDPRQIERAGAPFNGPTKACVLRSGEIYVADGYGNARVHHFSPDGELQASWGSPGEGPGEFMLVHSVAATPDEQRLFVADRENDRLQVFDRAGAFLEEWTGVHRPCGLAFDPQGRLFVAELGYRAGRAFDWLPPVDDASPISRCSVFDPAGELLARWGTADACAPGSFFAAHGLCVDSRGDVYVSEVTWSAGGKRGEVPETCHTLQKFTPAG